MADEVDPDLQKLVGDMEEVEREIEDKKVEEESIEEADNSGTNDDPSVNEEAQDEFEDAEAFNEELSKSFKEEFDADDDDDEEALTNHGLIESEASKIASETNERGLQLFGKMVDLLDKHSAGVDAMFSEAEEDRKRVEDVIGILMTKITDNNDYKSADVQSLASLFQTKSDITRNRASMMDAISKLFAALKNNNTIDISSNASEMGKEEVEKLLDPNRPRD